MDSNALVNFQIDAGQRLVVQLIRDGFKVVAAFWVKAEEYGDSWYLYIASPVVEEKGQLEGYRALDESLRKLEDFPLSISEVKLVGATNPITKDVLAILSLRSAKSAISCRDRRLGDLTVDAAYIYPLNLLAVPSLGSEIPKEVFSELFRILSSVPGPYAASRVTLRDGSCFSGVPFSIQSGGQRPPIVQFIVENEFAPRILGIDEIASIQ